MNIAKNERYNAKPAVMWAFCKLMRKNGWIYRRVIYLDNKI